MAKAALLFLLLTMLGIRFAFSTPRPCGYAPQLLLHGVDILDEYSGNTTVLALMDFKCTGCTKEVSWLKKMVMDMRASGVKKVAVIIVAALDEDKSVLQFWRPNLEAEGIRVLQETETSPFYFWLGAMKKEFLIYDGCQRLAYHIQWPESSLFYPHVLSAVYNATFKTHDECGGTCPAIRPQRPKPPKVLSGSGIVSANAEEGSRPRVLGPLPCGYIDRCNATLQSFIICGRLLCKFLPRDENEEADGEVDEYESEERPQGPVRRKLTTIIRIPKPQPPPPVATPPPPVRIVPSGRPKPIYVAAGNQNVQHPVHEVIEDGVKTTVYNVEAVPPPSTARVGGDSGKGRGQERRPNYQPTQHTPTYDPNAIEAPEPEPEQDPEQTNGDAYEYEPETASNDVQPVDQVPEVTDGRSSYNEISLTAVTTAPPAVTTRIPVLNGRQRTKTTDNGRGAMHKTTTAPPVLEVKPKVTTGGSARVGQKPMMPTTITPRITTPKTTIPRTTTTTTTRATTTTTAAVATIEPQYVEYDEEGPLNGEEYPMEEESPPEETATVPPPITTTTTVEATTTEARVIMKPHLKAATKAAARMPTTEKVAAEPMNDDEDQEMVEMERGPPIPRTTRAPFRPPVINIRGLNCSSFDDYYCYRQQRKHPDRPLHDCCYKGIYLTEMCVPNLCTEQSYSVCCFQKLVQSRFRCCFNASTSTTSPDDFSRCCFENFAVETADDPCCPRHVAHEHWTAPRPATEMGIAGICLPNVKIDYRNITLRGKLMDDVNFEVALTSFTSILDHDCPYEVNGEGFLYFPPGPSEEEVDEIKRVVDDVDSKK